MFPTFLALTNAGPQWNVHHYFLDWCIFASVVQCYANNRLYFLRRTTFYSQLDLLFMNSSVRHVTVWGNPDWPEVLGDIDLLHALHGMKDNKQKQIHVLQFSFLCPAISLFALKTYKNPSASNILNYIGSRELRLVEGPVSSPSNQNEGGKFEQCFEHIAPDPFRPSAPAVLSSRPSAPVISLALVKTWEPRGCHLSPVCWAER